jgi:hypothetical protein
VQSSGSGAIAEHRPLLNPVDQTPSFQSELRFFFQVWLKSPLPSRRRIPEERGERRPFVVELVLGMDRIKKSNDRLMNGSDGHSDLPAAVP